MLALTAARHMLLSTLLPTLCICTFIRQPLVDCLVEFAWHRGSSLHRFFRAAGVAISCGSPVQCDLGCRRHTPVFLAAQKLCQVGARIVLSHLRCSDMTMWKAFAGIFDLGTVTFLLTRQAKLCGGGAEDTTETDVHCGLCKSRVLVAALRHPSQAREHASVVAGCLATLCTHSPGVDTVLLQGSV